MRRICIFVAAVCLAAVSAGCWDRNELNDLAIAVGMGFDKQENGVRVVTQIVNPGEVASKSGAGGYRTPISLIGTTMPTIFEALRKLTTTSPRKIFTSHLKILVIGEDMARLGIDKVMDAVSRNPQFRSDFFLIVAKGTTAENVLRQLTPIEKIPADKMFKTLEVSQKLWAPSVKMTLDRFVSDLAKPQKGSVLTGIHIKGNSRVGSTTENMDTSEPLSSLEYSGLALFKDGKLIDWMTEEESKGYNYIKGNVQTTVGHHACPEGGTIAVEVTRTHTSVKGKVANGKPRIDVRLFAEQDVGEVQCKIDLTQSDQIAKLEAIGAQKLEAIMKASIRKAKKNRTDIFGFGDAIEDADPKAWSKLKDDWDDHFANLDVSVKVEVQIRGLGATTNSTLGQGG